MKIGIIKEGKEPIDRRVPLSPKQCVELKQIYPHLSLVVQPSEIRCFSDQEYLDHNFFLMVYIHHLYKIANPYYQHLQQ